MGDVKMLALIGAFLGWKLVLLTLALASVLGSLVGLGLILARRGDMKYALPFGTFLAGAAMFAAAAGEHVVAWYMGSTDSREGLGARARTGIPLPWVTGSSQPMRSAEHESAGSVSAPRVPGWAWPWLVVGVAALPFCGGSLTLARSTSVI